MIFTAYVLYSLRLFKLKTEGQATKTENLTEKNVKLKSKFSIILGQLWILKSERIRKRILRFFTKQINPRSVGSRCVKGTEESLSRVGSSVR